MIKPKSKQQAFKVFELLEQRARAQVMARYKPFAQGNEFANYFDMYLKIDDKIMEEVFGTSDLVKLGYRFGILCDEDFETKRPKRVIKKKAVK